VFSYVTKNSKPNQMIEREIGFHGFPWKGLDPKVFPWQYHPSPPKWLFCLLLSSFKVSAIFS
jgi:hypothetical protein